MRIALVFSGGGGKGSYQIGVYKALNELGLTNYITSISSTSIGAINSVLLINNDIDEAIYFWENIKRRDVAPINKNLYKIFLRRSLSTKDNLRMLIESNLDLKKLEESNIELIVTCTKVFMGYPKRKIFNLNKKNRDEIVDIILASCTIPCLFRAHKMKKYPKTYFYDGGIMGRAPIEGLKYDEFDKIIVVHLDNLNRLNPIKYRKKKYINIYPSIYQGGIYQGTYGFTQKLAKKRIETGYLDTMKKLKDMDLKREVENE